MGKGEEEKGGWKRWGWERSGGFGAKRNAGLD